MRLKRGQETGVRGERAATGWAEQVNPPKAHRTRFQVEAVGFE